ncbi:22041_t:CDS:1, partial [Cetraspora pellucida]
NTEGSLKFAATTCSGGNNDYLIVIFDGIDYVPHRPNIYINQFDTNNQQWTNITSV